jgi:hypothetical protein
MKKPPKAAAAEAFSAKHRPEAAAGAARARFDAAYGSAVVVLPAGFTNRQRFHGQHAEHLWCSRCTRAFPNGTYRQVGSVRHCPYAGCSGHAIVDARDWAIVRNAHADYPGTPQPGTKYVFAAAAGPLRESPVPA